MYQHCSLKLEARKKYEVMLQHVCVVCYVCVCARALARACVRASRAPESRYLHGYQMHARKNKLKHTDTDTDTDTETQTQTQTQTQTHRHSQIHRHTDTRAHARAHTHTRHTTIPDFQ